MVEEIKEFSVKLYSSKNIHKVKKVEDCTKRVI